MSAPQAFSVELEGDLGLKDAEGLAQRLSSALADNSAVRIDAAGLTGADISLVQLLVATHRTAAASGKALTLSAPADGVLANVLTRAGILSHEGKPQTPEGDFWTGHTQESGKAA